MANEEEDHALVADEETPIEFALMAKTSADSEYEHNQDFHQIVDFVEASHIRYALTFNPTVHVSHIRQFWSTARIETTEEGTKILATVDGISSLPDAELFENLTLMGYNISLNQKFTFHKGQFSHQWKYLIHTIIQCLSPKSIGFNEFSSNIATALVGGVQVVPTAAEVATATVSIPTGSGVLSTASPTIPTAHPIFTTATESTPYARRKGKETMVESKTPKKKKRKMMIDGLDMNNETVAKYLQEYYQFVVEFPIKRRIELISDLVKYQDHYVKVLKYQTQQRKPLSRKQQKEFYMSVLKSHAEEAKRFKRKRVWLEHDSSKKLKTSKEVPEEKLKEMMELIPLEEVYVEALQVNYPIIDWEVHTEGQRSYWKIIRLGVKETLSIRPAVNDKEKELWVELKRLYEPDVEDLLDEFPLPEQLPTANEDKFPLLIQSDATAEELYATAEVKE
nr:hypothetical protein [Tanacetum cinerariifolium]